MKRSNRNLILILVLMLVVVAVISGILISQFSKQKESSNTQQLSCPQLSNAILYGYDAQAETWIAEKIDYSTETERLVFDPRVSWFSSTPEDRGFPNLEPDKGYYMCDSGSRHIELRNAGDYKSDYVYCGDFIRPIVLYKVDANGNIINNINTSVEIIFDSKTKNYVDTRCGTYKLFNAVQTEESPIIPNLPVEPEPYGGPLSTGGYVYDDKLDYGFEYPDGWEMYMDEDNFPDENIKKAVAFEKDINIKLEGTDYESLVSVRIDFIVKSATDLQEVENEFKQRLSGTPILKETTVSVNNINGHDILAGEENGWKMRQTVFFVNGTAYIFQYSSQDELYRMYEETFNNTINSFDIE